VNLYLVDSFINIVASETNEAPAENFLMCPHFSFVPPYDGHNDCLLPTERQLNLLSSSVGSAVSTSTGEVGGTIKVMGPSAMPCRLLGY